MSRNKLIISTNGGDQLKKFDYKGKKNISGERIREARIKHHWTQADLAAKLQVAEVIIKRDSISRIEKGTRLVTDYEIFVMAQLFNVSPLWLIGWE